ncbi:MAG: hypothetical protein Q9187_001719 [Circinaria calcarea]
MPCSMIPKVIAQSKSADAGSMEVTTEYIAAGGNRHPAAADWDSISGLVAFGSDRNVALWRPLSDEHRGVESLLSGHADKVNAVRFFPGSLKNTNVVLSGSVDQTIRVWRFATDWPEGYENAAVLEGHTGSVNCIAVLAGSNVIASGAADATIRIWTLNASETSVGVELLQTIKLSPRFFPLALALDHLGTFGAFILAVGGTKSLVQIYIAGEKEQTATFGLQAILPGHEGWIRSLDFVAEDFLGCNDLLLASASQDKYIRLWRVHEAREQPTVGSVLRTPGKLLSNKDHQFKAAGVPYSLTFEALLLGHEDWIYTVSWKRSVGRLELLSASADNSLAIWEADKTSGIWICTTRLGEISAQKGSTTATGSTGGFWIGLWSSDGASILSLGRTGSWRFWKRDSVEDRWVQSLGISGHVKNVKGIAWAKDGAYLLSTSSDQTTRLHAEWKRKAKRSWHEFARPQIHGYDLNCVDTFRHSQFISGADEKLLRVFDEPRAVADILERLSGTGSSSHQHMADAANIPVLGLSNKAVGLLDDDEDLVPSAGTDHLEAPDPISDLRKFTLPNHHPPLEDQLARHTLWPEREKLYGHGYEISTVAASHNGSVVATACKASSIEHAAIRLYDTRQWREVRAPMLVHSLTVTCLRFSEDDQFLLSAGRDRQLAVFIRNDDSPQTYALQCQNPKAHSRMILGAAWAPLLAGRSFATAGRDKYVKLWRLQDANLHCKGTIGVSSSVTSIDFSPVTVGNTLILAVGTETGGLFLHSLDASTLSMRASHNVDSR